MVEHPNPNTPEKAEQARQERYGDPEDTGTVRVRALATVSGADGKTHEAGSTFTAQEASVEQALARGLVERVEDEPKGKRTS